MKSNNFFTMEDLRKMNVWRTVCFACCAVAMCGCGSSETVPDLSLERANGTLVALYENYSIAESPLLREYYPFNGNHSVDYLGNGSEHTSNPYSYLWPYSGTLSAVTALWEATGGDERTVSLLNKHVLPGLEHYLDTTRVPYAYASYVNSAPLSDRFYDDNIWLGIDFSNLYIATSNKLFLDKALLVWDFIESGTDGQLGGGVYWCEQKKQSKNTCSNAPAAVLALKLYIATRDSTFLEKGERLYHWVKDNLQDTTDYLYFDNIELSGRVDKTKYAYNSGQMMQAAALLYNLTGQLAYLHHAQQVAKSCHQFFFDDFIGDDGQQIKLLQKGNTWFQAVMLRGFVELYRIDKNAEYINSFKQCLDYAWSHARDENGLFNKDWSGMNIDQSKELLTQAAVVELYATLAIANQVK